MSRSLVPAIILCLLVHPALLASGKPQSSGQTTSTPSTQILYIAGTSSKVCQLTGEIDKEYGVPTVSQTESRYGFIRTDNGYSFEYEGRTYFLFGDSAPTATFDGHPNGQTDPPRTSDDNDAIAFVPDTVAGPFLKLDFVTDSIGAYKNPVVFNAAGQPAITLRTNETPVSGISDAGRMFVIFGTDNFLSNPPSGTSSPNGGATRTVVAVSDDSARTFHYLYNFSTAPGAKFIFCAIASGGDGYLYFWGAEGDTMYRKSPLFLARKPVGKMADSTAIEYLSAVEPDGAPDFMRGEKNATPVFHDSLPDPSGTMTVADDVGEVGVEWNPYVRSWIMLYNSANNTPANPRGIYMRSAPHPWGPWSAPQTVFNATRDSGFCYFIHRAVNATHPACDSLSGQDRLADGGGDYSPYFISRLTTGDSLLGTSTVFFVMSTWNPYEIVIMRASIQAVVTTGLPEPLSSSIPRFELEQNFPNPFNPTTVISGQWTVDSKVRLIVYDLLGREVAVLADGRYLAGRHSFTFDGTGLASGVYFYRLETGGYSATKTMLMIR